MKTKNSSVHSPLHLRNVLADTCWYALTARLTEVQFEKLVQQRVATGYTAIQVVAGIPPEVGPEHPAAAGPDGAAWDLGGQINQHYLDFARARIQRLNDLGLRVIVYGAWGPQIDWIGVAAMERWWHALVHTVNDLDVTFCLTGEWNLWITRPDRLLPNLDTDALARQQLAKMSRFDWFFARPIRGRRRFRQWRQLARSVFARTHHRLLIHPSWGIAEPAILGSMAAAQCVQTGHQQASRAALWQLPRQARQQGHDVINLEPWYEGIHDDFSTEDQLYAFWVSMLSQTLGYCYGAQGIWNVGDGAFLSHWGTQTFEQALTLDTPGLISKSHDFLKQHLPDRLTGSVTTEATQGQLHALSIDGDHHCVTYYPTVKHAAQDPHADLLFDPLIGETVDGYPDEGPIVTLTRPSSTPR